MSETICYCEPNYLCHSCYEKELETELQAELQAWNEFMASQPETDKIKDELPF
jgi:hypothetical protein